MHSVAFITVADRLLPQQFVNSRVREDASPLIEAGLALSYIEKNTDLSDINPSVLVFCVCGRGELSFAAELLGRFGDVPAVIHGTAGFTDPDGRFESAGAFGTAAALRRIAAENGRKVFFRQDTVSHSCSDEIALAVRIAVGAAELHCSSVGVIGAGESVAGCDTLRRALGVGVRSVDILEIAQRSAEISGGRKQEVIDRVLSEWRITAQLDPLYFAKLSGYYLAISDMAAEMGVSAVTLDDEAMKRLLGFAPAPLYMLLSRCDRLSVIPQHDVFGNVCQMIVKLCTGREAGHLRLGELLHEGALMYSPDFIIGDFTEGDTLLSAGGYSDEPAGLVNVSDFVTGAMTLSCLYEVNGRLCMHICTGKAVRTTEWNEIGRRRLSPKIPSVCFIPDDIDSFLENVCAERYIVSRGDVGAKLALMCMLLGIENV